MHPFGLFSQEKTPPVQENSFLTRHFYKLSLSNIMKHGESDVEQQISIQGIHVSAFGNYLWKREGSFNPCILSIKHDPRPLP